MPRPKPEDISSAGQDSFLDVVTNIVGILIILVMLVGGRARKVIQDAMPVQSDRIAALAFAGLAACGSGGETTGGLAEPAGRPVAAWVADDVATDRLPDRAIGTAPGQSGTAPGQSGSTPRRTRSAALGEPARRRPPKSIRDGISVGPTVPQVEPVMGAALVGPPEAP